MVVKLANNASSTLAGSINSSVTSLSVASGDAGKFPVLGAGDWFPLTVVDSSGNMEIMRVTARSGATLTVVRGQEGTTAKSFAAGSKCDLRLTAAAQVDHEHALSAIVGLVAALAAKADDTEITDLYAALGLKADAAAVSAALSGKASLLSDGTSDNTFADTDELAYVTGTTQKRGTLAGLVTSIFTTARAITNAIFLTATLKFRNATGFDLTFNTTALTANRAVTWPNAAVNIGALSGPPDLTLTSVSGSRTLGTVYQNTGSTCRVVTVDVANNSMVVNIGPTSAVAVRIFNDSQSYSNQFLVPPGWYYRATGTTLNSWYEGQLA